MDEIGLKPFCPYNIIMAIESGKRREKTFQFVEVMI
jgi:hypothetical protein